MAFNTTILSSALYTGLLMIFIYWNKYSHQLFKWDSQHQHVSKFILSIAKRSAFTRERQMKI